MGKEGRSEGDRGQTESEKIKEHLPRKLEGERGDRHLSCGLIRSGHCLTLDPALLSGSGVPGQRDRLLFHLVGFVSAPAFE